MAIQRINEGISGQEAADIIYNNDLENTPVASVGGSRAPSGDAVIAYIDDGVGADVASIGDFEIIESVIYDGGRGGRQQVTSTFSGYGDTYGGYKNFNTLYIRYLDRADILKATRLKFRICENDRLGAVLREGEIELNVPDGAEVWLRLSFQTVANAAGVPIWFEFWTNGKCDRFTTPAGSAPPHAFYYKTYDMNFDLNFAQDTKLTTADTYSERMDVRFINETRRMLPSAEFAEAVLNEQAVGEISPDETRAVSGAAVYAKTRAMDDIIEYKVQENAAVQLGGNTLLYSASTFAGWGQGVGVRQGFNFLQMPVYPFDPANPCTYFELRIRDTDWQGEVLFTQRITGAFTVGQKYDIVFDVGAFANEAGKNLFVQVNSDGYFGPYGTASGAQYGGSRWTTSKGASTVPGVSVNVALTVNFRIIWGEYSGALKQSVINDILAQAGGVTTTPPDVPVISTAYLFPATQYNIYNRNAVVPVYGDRIENYSIDFTGSVGAQFKRGFRLSPIPENLNASVSLNVNRGRTTLKTVTQTLRSAAIAAGNGVTRKVLIVGDSTVNGSNISTPLRTLFEADVMNIELIGTLGAAGVKHEGRGGWTVNDYYGIGRVLYTINVTGITTPPAINAVYAQGGVNYTVVEVNLTGGAGYFSVQSASSNRPVDAAGTLTKVSGAGDATITYGTSGTVSSNPFYNPATQRFDIGHYLTTTGQTMAGGDWVFFQLGINDVFGLTTAAEAEQKTITMASQMRYILDNIRAYNADIRVGVVVTFPPADQDAFGTNYTNGQTAEMYVTTGLIAWQKKLIAEYDNATERSYRRYLVPANLNLDTEYNYPSSAQAVNSRNTTTVIMQNNGVHPAPSGYAQIADTYAGLIKYFA